MKRSDPMKMINTTAEPLDKEPSEILLELCQQWFPEGAVTGYVAPMIHIRDKRHGSIMLDTDTSEWKNCGTDESGDLFDLYDKLYGIDRISAILTIGQDLLDRVRAKEWS